MADLHFAICATNLVEIWKRQNRWEDKKRRRRQEQEETEYAREVADNNILYLETPRRLL